MNMGKEINVCLMETLIQISNWYNEQRRMSQMLENCKQCSSFNDHTLIILVNLNYVGPSAAVGGITPSLCFHKLWAVIVSECGGWGGLLLAGIMLE